MNQKSTEVSRSRWKAVQDADHPLRWAVYSELDDSNSICAFLSEANAVLIATAPELYEACKTALMALRSYQYGNNSPDLAQEICKAVEMTIAKAEGK